MSSFFRYHLDSREPTNGNFLPNQQTENGTKPENGEILVTVKDGDTTGAQAVAAFTNNKDVGSLKLKKTVNITGASAKDKYVFNVLGADGKYYGTDGNGYAAAQAIEVIPGADWLEIKNLPVQKYTVSEVTGANDSEISVDGYNVTVEGNGQEANVTAGQAAEATIINNYTQQEGALQITKSVTVNGASVTEENKGLVNGTYKFQLYKAGADDKKTGTALTVGGKNEWSITAVKQDLSAGTEVEKGTIITVTFRSEGSYLD